MSARELLQNGQISKNLLNSYTNDVVIPIAQQQISDVIPTPVGHTGSFLASDGTNLIYATPAPGATLPPLINGLWLTNDGTNALWASQDSYTKVQTDALLLPITSDIMTINGEITTLNTDISNITNDITTLQSDVSTLQTDVATNTTDISTLTSTVSGLSTTVLGLSSTVATQTGQISTLNSQVTTLQTDVTNNTSDITTLQTDVTNNTSDIATLQTDVTNNTSDIATNTSNIITLQTTVSSQGTAITALQASDTTQNSEIAILQSNLVLPMPVINGDILLGGTANSMSWASTIPSLDITSLTGNTANFSSTVSGSNITTMSSDISTLQTKTSNMGTFPVQVNNYLLSSNGSALSFVNSVPAFTITTLGATTGSITNISGTSSTQSSYVQTPTYQSSGNMAITSGGTITVTSAGNKTENVSGTSQENITGLGTKYINAKQFTFLMSPSPTALPNPTYSLLPYSYSMPFYGTYSIASTITVTNVPTSVSIPLSSNPWSQMGVTTSVLKMRVKIYLSNFSYTGGSSANFRCYTGMSFSSACTPLVYTGLNISTTDATSVSINNQNPNSYEFSDIYTVPIGASFYLSGSLSIYFVMSTNVTRTVQTGGNIYCTIEFISN